MEEEEELQVRVIMARAPPGRVPMSDTPNVRSGKILIRYLLHLRPSQVN